MRPQTKGFLWGAATAVVLTWVAHAVWPTSRAIGQPGG
jgi:hypothetical protein